MKGKIRVSHLNIISDNLYPDYRSMYVHCEIEDDGPGGEAFGSAILVHKEYDQEFELKREIIKVREYNEVKIIESIQKIIDDLNPESWKELIDKTSDSFHWI